MQLSSDIPQGQIPPGVEFREATKIELAELRKGRSDLPEYFYRDLNDESAERCWVGLREGKLGFVAWISYRGSSRLVRVGDSEVELAYIYCLKDLRGQRLTANAVPAIGRTLCSEGVTSLLAVANSRNPAIIKSFLSCGFVRVGSIRRFFGLFTWPRPPVDYSQSARRVSSTS
jgi:RimJ/RimL family protein N-acetyltransferase